MVGAENSLNMAIILLFVLFKYLRLTRRITSYDGLQVRSTVVRILYEKVNTFKNITDLKLRTEPRRISHSSEITV